MKNLIVLGSTGSIGTQTLDVVREHPDLFHVSVLVANRSDGLLEKQIEEFQPELAVLSDEAAYLRLKERYQGRTELAGGRRAVIEAAAYPAGEVVVTSLMGFAGLEPTMAALEAGKDIALANKETLVVAGELVMAKARELGRAILVNDRMETNIPDLYAAGDCVEFAGMNYALWPEADSQGQVAGANACGDEAHYETQIFGMTMHVANTELYAIGKTAGQEPFRTVEFRDPVRNTLKKYFFLNNILCGVTLIGDTGDMVKVTDQVNRRASYSEVFGN